MGYSSQQNAEYTAQLRVGWHAQSWLCLLPDYTVLGEILYLYFHVLISDIPLTLGCQDSRVKESFIQMKSPIKKQGNCLIKVNLDRLEQWFLLLWLDLPHHTTWKLVRQALVPAPLYPPECELHWVGPSTL